MLITNLRSFLLVTRDENGPWSKVNATISPSPRRTSGRQPPTRRRSGAAHGEQFVEYLKRVIQHPVPLTSPRDLAWYLASYARDARARIDRADMRDLATIRAGFEEALGLTFEGERGEHFFRSTLARRSSTASSPPGCSGQRPQTPRNRSRRLVGKAQSGR